MGLPGPGRPSARLATALSTVAVVVLGALVWYLQGGTSTTGGDEPTATTGSSPSASYSAEAAPDGGMPAVDPVSGLPYVALEDLPAEAAETVELVDRGGPFPYPQDGSTFRNFERLLPDHPEGYYKEYTVETPGSPDRGARRIVAGAEGELYWTEDHYESFERIWR